MVWGSVDFKHFKNGMYEKLSLTTEMIAHKNGFDYSMGLASNISSQSISFNKMMYQPVFAVKYGEFVYKGKKVFEQIKDT